MMAFAVLNGVLWNYGDASDGMVMMIEEEEIFGFER